MTLPVSPASQTASAASATGTRPLWTDPARASAFEHWLQGLGAQHSLNQDTLRLASADASFRRYLRIDTASGLSCIIMDAPPALENSRPFVDVAALMAQAGLRVPKVLAWDEAQGFMLLSDLGSPTMMDIIRQQAPAEPGPPLPTRK